MSLRKCINEKCRDCIYDSIVPGTWRQQVALCSVKSCALYDVRAEVYVVLFPNQFYPTMGSIWPNIRL